MRVLLESSSHFRWDNGWLHSLYVIQWIIAVKAFHSCDTGGAGYLSAMPVTGYILRERKVPYLRDSASFHHAGEISSYQIV